MAACAVLVGIHASFVLHVLRRNVVCVDLALAPVAALGATAAFLLGHAPQSLAAHGYALLATLVAAMEDVPRHASIHNGGVVATARPLAGGERSENGVHAHLG